MADETVTDGVVADDGSKVAASRVPRIVLEASEGPGGAPVIFVDGIHSRMRSNNIVKLSFFQDLPGASPSIEGDEIRTYPQRRIVAYLSMDAVRFVDIVMKLNGIMDELIDGGVVVIESDNDE